MQTVSAPALFPGSTTLGKKSFHKNHYFDKFGNDVYYLSDKKTIESRCDQGALLFNPKGTANRIPAWIAYNGQKLQFKAYFQENNERGYHVRVVIISFFLEDSTIRIVEPSVSNSGLEQGVLVKRQRIHAPYSYDCLRHYEIIDFNIGVEIEIFGRLYKITNCDKFTRRFLNRMGIFVPDHIDIPLDTFTRKGRISTFAKKPKKNLDTLENFLKYDRKVLRFYGYWDDRESPNGILHDLEIHYFLADNTVEIKEISEKNSGQDASGMFLKRMKVPKVYKKLEPIGSKSPLTVLNVMGENIKDSYLIIDPLDLSISNDIDSDCYKDSQLNIGSHMNVFGREIVIVDMDESTKDYYRERYGVEDFKPLERPKGINDDDMHGEVKERYIPPYNGFGSYEDSLGNCFRILLKAPLSNFSKSLQMDKQGLDSRVLRFKARMLSDIPEFEDRRFIISIYLVDDTISIFEQAKRNSGFSRSYFQTKRKVPLPGQNLFSSSEPKYYKPEDFYIGARVNLFGFHFELLSADVYTFRYMEINHEKFSMADIALILKKLQNALRPVRKEFLREYCGEDAVINYRKLKEALTKYLGDDITEHEMITIARHFSREEKENVSAMRDYVRSLVHTELQKSGWNGLDRLSEDIAHWDRAKTGFLSRDTLYRIVRGCRLPINIDLLNSMLDHLLQNEEGLLDCKDLQEFLNTKINPTEPRLPARNDRQTDMWLICDIQEDGPANIDWHTFINELGLQSEENI
ncbi:EF-hand domain-containing family member C2-like [Prorops nasuta]|uniref:EF-hand domain-containing family member C2-like n=1 Tax=Prorops nasuta TaxID=863751 RepID=UPI0034CE3BA2